MASRLPTTEDVRRVLTLACLEVREGEELEGLARDLAQMAAHAEDLAELDLEGVEPSFAVLPSLSGGPARGGSAGQRDDAPGVSLPVEVALAEAPLARDGGFAVPAFVGES